MNTMQLNFVYKPEEYSEIISLCSSIEMGSIHYNTMDILMITQQKQETETESYSLSLQLLVFLQQLKPFQQPALLPQAQPPKQSNAPSVYIPVS